MQFVEFVVLLVLVWIFFFKSGGGKGQSKGQGGSRMQACKLASKTEGLEELSAASCPSQAWEVSEGECPHKRQGRRMLTYCPPMPGKCQRANVLVRDSEEGC